MSELQRFRAKRFLKPMERGQTLPILVVAENQKGESDRFVVKTMAGFGDRPEGASIDCLVTLLARAFGLLAPEPVLVELTDAIAYGASDYPDHANLIRSSVGWNYGTRYLGENWKPWMTEGRPRGIEASLLQSVFAFDGMMQNGDRLPDNPNMKWKGDQLAIFDHEKSLGFVRKFSGELRPWRNYLSLSVQQGHCLAASVKQSIAGGKGELAKGFWEDIEEAKLLGLLAKSFKSVELAAPDLQIDLPIYREYVNAVTNEIEDFFGYLTASVQS